MSRSRRYDRRVPKVDYERIGERMYAEFVSVKYTGNAERFVEMARKAAETGRGVILDCTDPDIAGKAVSAIASAKPILNGVDASNYEEMSRLAGDNGLVLGVRGTDLDELYGTVGKLKPRSRTCSSMSAAVPINPPSRRRYRSEGGPSSTRTGIRLPSPSMWRRSRPATRMQAARFLFTLKYGRSSSRQDDICHKPAPRPAEHLHRPTEADEGGSRHHPLNKATRTPVRHHGGFRADVLRTRRA